MRTLTRLSILTRCRLACLVLVLCGCGSNAPAPTQYYLLTNPEPVARSIAGALGLSLAQLSLPVYLQSRSIAVVAGNTQVRNARGHRWAEPLVDGVRRYLEEALALPVDEPDTLRLDVAIAHLHGSEAGRVVLDLNWRIRERGSDQALAAGRFSDSIEQGEAGYDALVLAHRALLERFVRYVEGEAGGLANQKQAAPSKEAAAISEKPSS